MTGSAWDGLDIEALVSLETIASLRYRSRYGDPNLNGRSYGGQVLSQAMMAASLGVPDDRPASTLQLLFLRGADPDQPIDFAVEILQEGKRFSSRHVRGTQANGQVVLDAHATFCAPLPGPRHAAAFTAIEEDPENLPGLTVLPPAIIDELRPLGPYSPHIKPAMDFRIPDIKQQLSAQTATSNVRYWLRAKHPLPSNPRTNAAAFAYLSDWWLNFSSFGSLLRDLQSSEPLYIASLNHCIWFHRAFSPAAWMHFASESHCAEGGRGLSIARIHDQDGNMLATASQESLMVAGG
jgi:acyl-CoA thioesterase-2